MEVLDSDWKKVLWEVVDDHVTEEPTENDDVGLQGFIFFFNTDERRDQREILIEYPYLFLLMKLCPGDLENKPERIIMSVDELNGRAIWEW